MRILIRTIALVFVLTMQLSPLAAQQPRQQEEFTPIDQLPPQEVPAFRPGRNAVRPEPSLSQMSVRFHG